MCSAGSVKVALVGNQTHDHRRSEEAPSPLHYCDTMDMICGLKLGILGKGFLPLLSLVEKLAVPNTFILANPV